MSVLLFYGGQLVTEITTSMITGRGLGRYIQEVHGQEIYNGGYIYAPWQPGYSCEWWRCDMTPCLVDHVPKELRALALLLT